MAVFIDAYKFLIPLEKGTVNHPADPGGVTKDGISLRWYRRAVNHDATPMDILNLSDEEIKDLYLDYFWHEISYFAIQSQDLANRLFALHVHSGKRNASRVLQRAVNRTIDRNKKITNKIKVDGIIGHNTIAAVNSLWYEDLLESFVEETKAFYKRLIEKNPSLKPFEKGWFNRAEK